MSENQKSVIILEDNQDIADFLGQLVTSYGVSHIVCTSQNEVLQAIDQHEIILALLDIMLPETDGRNVAGAIREKGCSFPIYFMTGVHTKIISQELQAVTNGVLRKPFSINTLRNILDKSLKTPSVCEGKAKFRREVLEIMAAIASDGESLLRKKEEIYQTFVDCGEKTNPQVFLELLDNFETVVKEGLKQLNKRLEDIKSL